MKTWQGILLILTIVVVPILAKAQYVVKELSAPGPEARGLAWDGEYLWCADADEDAIFKIDPALGQVIYSIPFDVPEAYGGGITWGEDGTLWVTRSQYFHKLNPTTGQELAEFHCPGG